MKLFEIEKLACRGVPDGFFSAGSGTGFWPEKTGGSSTGF